MRTCDNTIPNISVEKRKPGFRKTDGVAYSYFCSSEAVDLSALGGDEFVELTNSLNQKNPIDLEIAATIHWLKTVEKHRNWREELKVRKKSKASDERITSALNILDEIGL